MKGSIRFNDAVNAEVTTDGTEITKVVNVATGEEYGGGGGDNVATVVLVNNTGGDIYDWWWAIIDENMDAVSCTNFSDSGTYLCPIYHEGQYIAYPFLSFDNLTLSGDAESVEVEGDNFIIIKGDCTITIAAE